MQSGITASEELKTAFQKLLAAESSSQQRGLLVTISKSPESLAPDRPVAGGSGSFEGDLANIGPLISDKAASYILLRDDKNAGKIIGVTYVPDAAPVRQKMLFASTRLTLVRELGSEHFSSTLFATTPEELTAEGWAKHEAHGSLAAPLTEEERNLEGIREAEAQESMGTMSRKATGGVKSSGLPMDDEVRTALESLKAGELALVSMEIDLASESLKLASKAATCSPDELAGHVSPSAPRYTVYSHKAAGSPRYLFVYTCPTSSSIKERMIYAASSRVTYIVMLPQMGLDATHRLEASDPSEVTGQAVLEELGLTGEQSGETSSTAEPATGSAASSRGGFARPKRPGKR